MLSEYFQKLRSNKRPIFMAIDNVFEVEDLENLLPFKLSKDILPAFSSIAVTCRNYRVIKALLNICHLQEDDCSQVFCYEPPFLDPEESKAVFAECGGMRADEHVELLDALVPLCEGLPLALTVLGKIFVDEKKRERREWEVIKKQMQVLDRDDEEMSPITKSLWLSYDKLKPSRQAAFLDVVNFFYGWPWETVERILDANVLNDLRNSSLISDADHWTKCNQSALRAGFQLYPSWSEFGVYWEPSRKRVVTMHDFTLRFGESLLALSIKVTIRDFPSKNHLHHLEAPTLRNLILQIEPDHEADSELDQVLEKATNLQMLFLHKRSYHLRENVLEANVTNFDVPQHRQHLQYLRLDGWKSSRRVMEMKLSCEIREIHLHSCQDVVQLPATPLHYLEWLSIYKCENFQGFSNLQCDNLKYLEVGECNSIARVPAELGYLGNLKSVEFRGCASLEDFPSLCNSNGPSHLVIKDCPRLRTLPAVSCPLQRLVLIGIQIANLVLEETACALLREVVLDGCSFEVLPSSICNAPSLEELTIAGCAHLKQIREVFGKLKCLTVDNCSVLKRLELPSEVGKAPSLQTLTVHGCEMLQELPQELGKLTSLTNLDVSACRCLVKLPDELGNSTSLTNLNVSWCKHLKGLPSSIGNASSLQALNLSGCVSLKELPVDLGKLTSLTKLDVYRCGNIEIDFDLLGSLRWLHVPHIKLPKSLLSLSQLQILKLSDCNAVELPDELGTLTSLRELWVDNCTHLQTLPGSIGDLISLNTLMLGSCRELESLPAAVCKISCLEMLRIRNCWSLRRLPEELGNLSCLKTVRLFGCDKLEKLPDSICNILSLETLSVEWCKSLVQLPNSICNAISMKWLFLSGCVSLKELPEELGMLKCLEVLEVGGCKGLKGLPRSLRQRQDLMMRRDELALPRSWLQELMIRHSESALPRSLRQRQHLVITLDESQHEQEGFKAILDHA